MESRGWARWPGESNREVLAMQRAAPWGNDRTGPRLALRTRARRRASSRLLRVADAQPPRRRRRLEHRAPRRDSGEHRAFGGCRRGRPGRARPFASGGFRCGRRGLPSRPRTPARDEPAAGCTSGGPPERRHPRRCPRASRRGARPADRARPGEARQPAHRRGRQAGGGGRGPRHGRARAPPAGNDREFARELVHGGPDHQRRPAAGPSAPGHRDPGGHRARPAERGLQRHLARTARPDRRALAHAAGRAGRLPRREGARLGGDARPAARRRARLLRASRGDPPEARRRADPRSLRHPVRDRR